VERQYCIKEFHTDKIMRSTLLFLTLILACADSPRKEGGGTPSQQRQARADLFLDTLQERTIKWFLDLTPQSTGLTPDRWPTPSPSSTAAVGFALTSYAIAAEEAIISRSDASMRVLTTLRFLWSLPQGDDPSQMSGYKGFYYHFINTRTGLREWNCELSTVDTGWLLAGVLFCQSYFDRASSTEIGIRALADSIYRRVDWQWAMGDTKGIAMGWKPEEGFHSAFWRGYNEAMIVSILALGSPTHPVPASVWDAWCSTYRWANHYGQEYLNFMALFGHQYTHAWIDFRGIRDAYMNGKGIDYFENSRRATYAHREYGRQNPNRWIDYSDSIWGWTACDGPKDTTFEVQGLSRLFRSYSARGTGAEEEVDDGTIAPTAAAGSLPFAPEICTPALKAMRRKYGKSVWTNYGFVDAFNPTYATPSTPAGWFDQDYLGIDQGPIVLMIENLRNELVWNVMKKNPYIVLGLKKAGFRGGWLDSVQTK
jgi:hypothetical protein